MNLRELEVFNAVMSCSSMTQAAKVLNVTQPAISIMMKHCESQLGFSLFQRVGGRLIPTPEAEELYKETGRVFLQLGLLNRMTQDLKVGRTGLLAVIGNPTLTNFLLPSAVTEFRRDRPDVRVRLETALSPQIVDRVARREFDLGLIYGPNNNPDADGEILGQSTIVCAMRSDHHLAACKTVHAAQLADLEVITFADGTPIRRQLEESMRENGRELQVKIEVSFSLTACFLAHEGAGVALVDRLVAPSGVFPNLVIRPLLPERPIQIQAVYPNNRPRSILSLEFELVLKAVVARREKESLDAMKHIA